jgi:hypothetical protein
MGGSAWVHNNKNALVGFGLRQGAGVRKTRGSFFRTSCVGFGAGSDNSSLSEAAARPSPPSQARRQRACGGEGASGAEREVPLTKMESESDPQISAGTSVEVVELERRSCRTRTASSANLRSSWLS